MYVHIGMLFFVAPGLTNVQLIGHILYEVPGTWHHIMQNRSQVRTGHVIPTMDTMDAMGETDRYDL